MINTDQAGLFGQRSRLAIIVGRAVGLSAWIVGTVFSTAPGDRPLAIALVVAGGLVVICTGISPRTRRLNAIGVILFTLSGFALMLTVHQSLGWMPPMFACFWAVVRFPGRLAVGYVVTTFVVLGAVATITYGPSGATGVLGGTMGACILAYSIRTARQRADYAERLLASEREAREATARAEVLAERHRLAREVHDILAHTLSAQIVQLEGARLLLRKDAPPADVLARVEQAQRLAREGLDETRQALDSLRGRTRPLLDTVQALAAESDAGFEVQGAPREVSPEANVAIQRTVQEALTNTRKHAPGARITVRLRYGDKDCEVAVTDSGAAPGSPAPLADSGGGYGLAGMRERAELLGGALTAGPHDAGGFEVRLSLPG